MRRTFAYRLRCLECDAKPRENSQSPDCPPAMTAHQRTPGEKSRCLHQRGFFWPRQWLRKDQCNAGARLAALQTEPNAHCHSPCRTLAPLRATPPKGTPQSTLQKSCVPQRRARLSDQTSPTHHRNFEQFRYEHWLAVDYCWMDSQTTPVTGCDLIRGAKMLYLNTGRMIQMFEYNSGRCIDRKVHHRDPSSTKRLVAKRA